MKKLLIFFNIFTILFIFTIDVSISIAKEGKKYSINKSYEGIFSVINNIDSSYHQALHNVLKLEFHTLNTSETNVYIKAFGLETTGDQFVKLYDGFENYDSFYINEFYIKNNFKKKLKLNYGMFRQNYIEIPNYKENLFNLIETYYSFDPINVNENKKAPSNIYLQYLPSYNDFNYQFYLGYQVNNNYSNSDKIFGIVKNNFLLKSSYNLNKKILIIGNIPKKESKRKFSSFYRYNNMFDLDPINQVNFILEDNLLFKNLKLNLEVLYNQNNNNYIILRKNEKNLILNNILFFYQKYTLGLGLEFVIKNLNNTKFQLKHYTSNSSAVNNYFHDIKISTLTFVTNFSNLKLEANIINTNQLGSMYLLNQKNHFQIKVQCPF